MSYKKYSIGIMQGRLTEPKGRGIQFFPFDNWEYEFKTAKEIGLDEIEFIFDYEDYLLNPLWGNRGEEVKRVMEHTDIKVNAVCFDYFMRRPFYKYDGVEKQLILDENKEVISHILDSMANCGVKLIEIPLVDDSSIKNEDEAADFRQFLLGVMKDAPKDIRFGLETDMPPKEFRSYIESFNDSRLGANYDSGNSSGIGYDCYEEITTLNDLIFNIHIKDRVYKGTTVKLGTGSADFDSLFEAIKLIKYKGTFILQAARGDEGKERENIQEQIQFLKGYINKIKDNDSCV